MIGRCDEHVHSSLGTSEFIGLESGVTTYFITWMLQTRSMAPSLIYTVSFSLPKIIQISVCQN